MEVYLTRHGQTDMNKNKLIQGRSDPPLNETGVAQAIAAGERLKGITFDAVYASPLQRAVMTASLISGVPEEQIITDSRVIEVDFGRYEGCKYYGMGPAMTAYWACPELFPAPKTVETIPQMVARAHSFVEDLKQQPYERVLLVCHGGIMRVLTGQLEGNPRGFRWRPKPQNAEVRIFQL